MIASCAISQEANLDLPVIKKSIWVPHDKKNMILSDSTITLIFEEYFDDSISIRTNKHKSEVIKIKTNKSLQMVKEIFTFPISANLPEQNSFVINFIQRKEIIEFSIDENYSFVYISYIDNVYYLEFSNYRRSYY
jgi:hypothetical protein